MGVVTAAARPHVFRIRGNPGTEARGGSWPVGEALLAMLGEANPDVADALADERAWLGANGYPEDLPLPALWWTPRTRVQLAGSCG